LGPLTLALPEGSVGLLGPNGAGKSTLIRLLLGILPPSEGTIKVLGEEVQPGNPALRGRIGYAPEGDAIFPELNGAQAVAYAGRLVGMPATEALQRAHQVLDYVELGEERYRAVEKYSTGMRQRLKLAQALVHDPELLILDEPTEGVDPEARAHLLRLLGELQRDHGVRILVSTHLLHDIEQLVENVVVLSKGQVVVQGPLAELRKAAQPAYVLRANAEPARIGESLAAAGLAWEPADGGVRVRAEDPRAILQAVQDAGLVVRALAPEELTLEAAFAQAVGGA
jgi:ABC-2 type transport system ATP-binding protein